MLSVGACAFVIVVLTSLGYQQATDGLSSQADHSLSSDALLVVQAVDQWNTAELNALRVVAANPATVRLVSSDEASEAGPSGEVQAILTTGADVRPDVDSVAILDPTGTIIASSNPVDLGSSVSQRDYFRLAMNGQSFTSGVSVSTITDAPAIFHSVPIRSTDGTVVGVVRSRAGLSQITQSVAASQNRVGLGATGILIDESGLVIASSVGSSWFLHPIVPLQPEAMQGLVDDRRWGRGEAPPPLGLDAFAPLVGLREPRALDWRTDTEDYRGVALPLDVTRWTYIAGLPQATIQATARDFLRTALGIAAIVLIVIIPLTSLIARGITRRIRQLTVGAERIASSDLPALVDLARALAAGDLTRDAALTIRPIDVQGKDEVGQLGAAFNQIVDGLRSTGTAFGETSANLRQVVGMIQVSAVRLASTGEQLGSATAHTNANVQQVAEAVARVASGAQEQSVEARESSEMVAQLLRVIDEVARSAQAQALSVSIVSRTAEAMASAAEEAAETATDVVAASQQSNLAAEEGAQAVQATVDGFSEIQAVVTDATGKVQELGKLGDRIGSVVGVIDDIAERTNMLALNAAIEAARAGEQGRGFAVVAEEVKNLAERSQAQTKTIAALIEEVQRGTRDAIQAMEQGRVEVVHGAEQAVEAGRALQNILESSERATQRVEEIAGTASHLAERSHEVSRAISAISAAIEEASAATEEMEASADSASQTIGDIAALASEHSAAAEEVSSSAVEMTTQVEEMSLQAQELAATAEELRGLVARFTLRQETNGAGSRRGAGILERRPSQR